jgi:hypothetical protein
VQAQPAIEVSGTYSFGDLARFQYFHTARRALPVVASSMGLLILATILISFIATAYAEPSWKGALSAAPFVLFGFMFLFWTWVIWILPYWTAKKQLAAQSYLREPTTLVFNSDSISGTWSSVSSTFAWDILKHARETRSLFLLYHAPNMAVIVPKRFFQNADQLDLWRQLVTSHLPIGKSGAIGRWC